MKQILNSVLRAKVESGEVLPFMMVEEGLIDTDSALKKEIAFMDMEAVNTQEFVDNFMSDKANKVFKRAYTATYRDNIFYMLKTGDNGVFSTKVWKEKTSDFYARQTDADLQELVAEIKEEAIKFSDDADRYDYYLSIIDDVLDELGRRRVAG